MDTPSAFFRQGQSSASTCGKSLLTRPGTSPLSCSMQYIFYGLVVRPDSPWKTFKEFVDYAKANPGKIRYSTAGPGTSQHLVMERLGPEGKD